MQCRETKLDSDLIRKDVRSIEMESEKHPIKIAGVDLCQIVERVELLLNVDTLLSDLTKKQNEIIFSKLEQFEKEQLDEPPVIKKRTHMSRKTAIALTFQG